MKHFTRLATRTYDPALCKTQLYFDRDVELIRCEEKSECKYKHHYNKMIICTAPAGKSQVN